MKETAVAFGEKQSLIGVVTEPDVSVRRARAPAVLMANVGVNHHVGPSRLWVELARALAKIGFVVLRFDLSGLGDSAQSGSTHSDLERWRDDARAAMTMLTEKYRVDRFAMVGLCSGVDTVHSVACADPRVVGAVFLDGYAFPTRRHLLERYARRALRTRPWELFLKRRYPRIFGLNEEDVQREGGQVFQREPVTREQFRTDLGALINRGVHLLYVYSGGVGPLVSYADQLHDMVAPLVTRERVQVELHENADHLWTMRGDRDRLLRTLSAWMDRHFPAARSSSASTRSTA